VRGLGYVVGMGGKASASSVSSESHIYKGEYKKYYPPEISRGCEKKGEGMPDETEYETEEMVLTLRE